MRKYLPALLLTLAVMGARADDKVTVTSLDQLFSTGPLWELGPEEFMRSNLDKGFRWLSVTSKDAARSAQPGLSFCGLHIWETLVRFQQGHLAEITLSLYNRGDAGDMEEEVFMRFINDADAKLTQRVGEKGVLFRAQERTNVAAIRRKSWVKGNSRIDLVWSFSEKSRTQGISLPRPEFARLQFTPFSPQQDPRKLITTGSGVAAKATPISLLELRNRVRRQPTGDVIIPTVPMVDQGLKGYCAAAVAERILRYYNREVDQHEIAQLANTSADSGTTRERMVTALRRIAGELRIDLTVLNEFKITDYDRLMEDYNHAAKRAGASELVYQQREGNTIFYKDPATVFGQADIKLLREARAKRDGAMNEFKNAISHYINNGVPLVWSTVVGIVKENPDPQGVGGHMRLIIGYNELKKEILYTDTWGAGHECKRMSLLDAWTITTGLYGLQPCEIRF